MESEDSVGDGGSFLSPQPIYAKLMRCASTPVADGVLGAIDFGDGATRLRVNKEENGWNESQELHLTFRGQGSDKSLESITYEKPVVKDRVRLLSEDLTYPSDSGFGSDLSAECSGDSPSLNSGLDTITSLSKKKKPKPIVLFKPSPFIPGKYEGLDRLDIINLLSDMGLAHCLENIWKCLSIEDIGRAQQVSALWRACILSDKHSNSRWQFAKSTYFENLNFHLPNNQRRQKLLKTSPRKAFSCVTNRLASPTSKPQIEYSKEMKNTSPGKFRHRLFTEEALNLRPEEQLKQCPRCTLPCRVNLSQSIGTCTMLGCKFTFCIKCLCMPHPDSPCRSSVGSSKQKAVVSSKKSKNRLRRL